MTKKGKFKVPTNHKKPAAKSHGVIMTISEYEQAQQAVKSILQI